MHGTRICLAADVEAHRGRDGRLYLLDFGRLFPPESPRQGETNPRKIFFCLLRPELVKKSDVPLSSDAFSLFQKDDAKNYALNGQVTVSTEILHKEIIPQMGMLLSELQSADDLMLIGTIHRSGINVRHLGELRANVTEPRMRQLLLSEMTARCIKVMIRAAMRDMMKQYTLPAVEPYTGVLVSYLNLCFGRSVDSALFWRSAGDARRPAVKAKQEKERCGFFLLLKKNTILGCAVGQVFCGADGGRGRREDRLARAREHAAGAGQSAEDDSVHPLARHRRGAGRGQQRSARRSESKLLVCFVCLSLPRCRTMTFSRLSRASRTCPSSIISAASKSLWRPTWPRGMKTGLV